MVKDGELAGGGAAGELLSPRFQEAMVYAARLHGTQRRKGTGIPYIAHPLAVASLVLEHGGTETEAIAALLHDTVEDQGGIEIYNEIKARFGDAVAGIVADCTDAWTNPKPAWRERKEKYLAHLAAAPEPVLLVSAADKLHNARSILADYRVRGEELWERFSGGREGTLWYYRSLAAAFAAKGPEPLAAELARVVAEIERLARRE